MNPFGGNRPCLTRSLRKVLHVGGHQTEGERETMPPFCLIRKTVASEDIVSLMCVPLGTVDVPMPISGLKQHVINMHILLL